jgi:DNA adenine methylase
MQSVLRYIGAKKINLDNYSIGKYDVYIEPFGGGFSTGLELIRQGYKGEVIYNDLDEKVANFWYSLRDHRDELLAEITKLRALELDYLMDKIEKPAGTEIERAAIEFMTKEMLTMKGMSYKYQYEDYKFNVLREASDLLQDVRIYNKGYEEIFIDYDHKSVFMLIDPPYTCEGVDKYYRCNSSKSNHDLLHEKIETLNCQWLLTYNDDEHIRSLYERHQIEVKSRNMYNRVYKELYISK